MRILEPRTFDCIDCGSVVHSFQMHHNDDDVCLICSYLRDEFPDPAERAKVRERLRANNPVLRQLDE